MFGNVGSSAATAGTLFNIANGLQRGGVSGNASAALGAASLANKGGFLGQGPAAGYGIGAAGGALSLYNGLQQGGVAGYGNAAIGGLRAGSGIAGLSGNSALAGQLGNIAGYAAVPLSLYNFAKNWQSGATGSDALQGAETGATIGSVVPGIGTLVGGLLGGAVGALSSAFGGGKTSAEAGMQRSVDATLNNTNAGTRAASIATMNPAQAFQYINGTMNAHNNSPGHSEGIEQVFGKNGINNLVGGMMPQINMALASGQISRSATPAQIYSQVVAPWLQSKGASINPNTVDVHGNNEGQNIIDSLQNLIGAWQQGSFTNKSKVGVAGQTVNIPAFGG